MTGPEDDHSNTRPISVAELLARNGTIGAPPVGGRRRRRRGATDSITVAELTGEIPIVRDHGDDAPATGRSSAAVVETPAETEAGAEAEAPAEPAEPAATNGLVEHVDETEAEVEPEAEVAETEVDVAKADAEVEAEAPEVEAPEASTDEDDDYAGAVADYQAHIEQRDADEDLDFFAPPRRSSFARLRFGMGGRKGAGEDTAGRKGAGEDTAVRSGADEDTAVRSGAGEGAAVRSEVGEDTAVEDIALRSGAGEDTATEDSRVGVGAEQMSPDPLDWSESQADEDAADAAVAVAEPEEDKRDGLPSYLRSPDNALFGGPDVADDVVRRGNGLSPADTDLEEDTDVAPSSAMSSFLRGVLVVGQCVVAVAFGAGLFIAFDQLWKWNSIVALVLGVLVILGLVVGVRVVRKTEDIGSTLIAVAVGALVTFGPLALMQAG